jgi:hypothetical protein
MKNPKFLAEAVTICAIIRGVWEGVSRVSMDTPVLKSHPPSRKKIDSSTKKLGENHWKKEEERK